MAGNMFMCMNDHHSDVLHLGEGVEVPGLVGSDAEVDDSSGEAVPQGLGELSVSDSHWLVISKYYRLSYTNTYQAGHHQFSYIISLLFFRSAIEICNSFSRKVKRY